MDKEKLFKIISLSKNIQEMGAGKDGFPFVSVHMSNDPCAGGIHIEIMDDGYRLGGPYDGHYTFKHAGDISDRVYENCIRHLEEMKEKAEGFFNGSGI